MFLSAVWEVLGSAEKCWEKESDGKEYGKCWEKEIDILEMKCLRSLVRVPQMDRVRGVLFLFLIEE